jgi:hypothetical protein
MSSTIIPAAPGWYLSIISGSPATLSDSPIVAWEIKHERMHGDGKIQCYADPICVNEAHWSDNVQVIHAPDGKYYCFGDGPIFDSAEAVLKYLAEPVEKMRLTLVED